MSFHIEFLIVYYDHHSFWFCRLGRWPSAIFFSHLVRLNLFVVFTLDWIVPLSIASEVPAAAAAAAAAAVLLSFLVSFPPDLVFAFSFYSGSPLISISVVSSIRNFSYFRPA